MPAHGFHGTQYSRSDTVLVTTGGVGGETAFSIQNIFVATVGGTTCPFVERFLYAAVDGRYLRHLHPSC